MFSTFRRGPNAARNTAFLGVHLSALLFGFSGLFVKWTDAHPLGIVFGRVFFASLVLGLFLFFRKQAFQRIPKGDALLVAVSGLILFIHWFSFFEAIHLSTVTLGLLTFATAPIFTALLEPFWFGEKIHLKNITAALLSIGGLWVLLPETSSALPSHGSGAQANLPALAWGVTSGFTFALLSLTNRKLRHSWDALSLNFYQNTTVGLISLPFLWYLSSPFPGFETILKLALLGVLCTALAYGLYLYSIRALGAHVATLVINLEPVYGIALAWFLLGEIPEKGFYPGAGMMLLATFLASLPAGFLALFFKKKIKD